MRALRGPLVAGALLLTLVLQACSLPDLPDLDEEQARARALPLTSLLYAADGSVITTLHAAEDRELVPFDRIPLHVRNAVVAIEDERFYEHRGVDLQALLRAAYANATAGRVVEGGSTITQQYVKNTVLEPERTVSRKLREAALALQLERRHSKDEILAMYLNTIYFGQGAYGIQAAAKTYFSKPVWRLSLAEGALLAGLISAPAEYDPVNDPEAALARRNLVLTRMRDLGMIGGARYDRAVRSKLRLRLADDAERYPAPYFVDYVKRWFLSNPAFGETYTQRYNLLFAGGLRIHTTLDPELQRMAEDAVRDILIFRRDPYAAVTVLDPRTGYIRAMVGGRNFFSTSDPFAKVNLATGGITGRQAGSAFKPFALVAALESGIPPQRVYRAPSTITIPQGEGLPPWRVQNYEGQGYGSMTLEQATIDSVNTVFAQVIMEVGPEKVVQVAKRMGIASPLRPVPSAVLGTNEVNTLDMASAYGTLATGGQHVTPRAVTRITDAEGRVVYEADPEPKRVLDPAVAYVAAEILQKVVQFGTGAAASIGRPVLGKTGTAQEYRDAWFVGAIPQLVAAVWVGFPEAQISMVHPLVRVDRVLGGTWPAQIWRAFMTKATEDMAVLDFPAPDVRSVVVAIDVTRGCLPNQFTPPQLVRSAVFVAGTEPTERCAEPTSYQPLVIPSAVGLPQVAATDLLEETGFRVAVETIPSAQPAGTVIGQRPGPGERALQSSTVVIVVASGGAGT